MIRIFYSYLALYSFTHFDIHRRTIYSWFNVSLKHPFLSITIFLNSWLNTVKEQIVFPYKWLIEIDGFWLKLRTMSSRFELVMYFGLLYQLEEYFRQIHKLVYGRKEYSLFLFVLWKWICHHSIYTNRFISKNKLRVYKSDIYRPDKSSILYQTYISIIFTTFLSKGFIRLNLISGIYRCFSHRMSMKI